MPYSAPSTVVAGNIYTPTMYNTFLQGNADSGYVRMLADSTAGGAVASFDFTSIPQTFAQLMLVMEGRGDTAANTVNVSVRMNNDSGANQYCWSTLSGAGTVATVADNTLATSALVGNIVAASGGASTAGAVQILIPQYTGTTYLKKMQGQWSSQYGSGAGQNSHGIANGFWNSTAAISRLTILPSAGNFAAGTRCTLYGLPA